MANKHVYRSANVGSGRGLTRRKFISGAAVLGAGSLVVRSRSARAAPTVVRFQAPAGVRFGNPNAVLLANFNRDHPDIQIAMETVPVQNFFPKISTEVSSKSDSIDFFMCISNLMYGFAQSGKVTAFEDVLPADYLADLVKDVPAHYLDTWRWKGKLYGLPNDSNAQWTFYRKDLFDEAGVTLPKTWADAPKVAKALSKGNVKGYTASLRRGEYAGAHFSSTLFSFGGDYWDKDFHPTLNGEAGRQAIEIMLEMMDYADPGSINAGEDDTAQAIASGVAAWAPLAWGRSDLTDAKKTPIADKIETALPPDGDSHPAAPALGGVTYMISSWSEKKEAAAKYIEYACSRAVMHTFVQNEGQPARTSALIDPENVKIGRYFPTLQKALAQGKSFPQVPESYQFLVEIGNHVAEILTRSVTPKQGLQEANDSVAKTLKDSGYL
jgi:ABC-type glycerol-3-phosphate transport system substrate-binding protein